ncbi:MAG TPA: PP2C family protein-serine/threonine phosphatase, partial [Polyangiaceae bacterium]
RTFVQRQVAGYVRSGDNLILSPAGLLARLNEEMAREDLEKHLTMFYGIIDLTQDTLLYANAGHFPWPVLWGSGQVRVLEHPSVPVGMVPGTRYEEHRLALGDGATLSVFSDGVLETLPMPTMDAKLQYLQGFFGRSDVTVEQARDALHLDRGTALADDVALLIIQRGETDGIHATA